jgi:hypothetical protein
MTNIVTEALVRFSIIEGELHHSIDTLEALPPRARGMLKALGTALLAERRTATLSVSGKEANAFLRKGCVPADEELELSLFKGIERSICWSLSDLALGWDHTDDGQQGGVFYWSGKSIYTRSADFDVAKDLMSSEYNGGGWLWEQWVPRAGGTIPYRRDGHLGQYLEDWVPDVHAAPPGESILTQPSAAQTPSTPTSAPRTRRRRPA